MGNLRQANLELRSQLETVSEEQLSECLPEPQDHTEGRQPLGGGGCAMISSQQWSQGEPTHEVYQGSGTHLLGDTGIGREMRLRPHVDFGDGTHTPRVDCGGGEARARGGWRARETQQQTVWGLLDRGLVSSLDNM